MLYAMDSSHTQSATTTNSPSLVWGIAGCDAKVAFGWVAAMVAGVTPSFRLPVAAVLGILTLCGLLVECVGQETPLWTAIEIQRLSPQDARQHREVRLRGVVTFTWDTGTTEIAIEDQTGAIWIPTIALPSDCRFGAEVEVEGETDAGIFGTYVHATRVRRLGQGTLPAPQRASYGELLAAPLYARRVEVSGIVRGQRVNPELGLNWLALEIASEGGRVTINVTHEITGHPELIDAEVRIRGVNLPSTDAQQQAFLPMINAYALTDVDVLTPAAPNPYEKPLADPSNLMSSASVAGAGHRVRVRGTVTFVSRTDSFFLQDNDRGIQVFLRESLRPVPGETVDVVGFPEPGAFSPVLRDADWRPSGRNGALVPLAVPLAEAAEHDGRLLSVVGRLAELIPGDREAVLVLEQGSRRCRIQVLAATAQQWRVGSILSATGVCSVEIGDWESLVAHRRPRGFSVLVQEPAAVTLVSPAPWWAPTRLVWSLAACAGILGCALVLVWLQARARLRETAHTREIARAQFVAVLSERNRFAREIHDTFAQGFAGISAQIEVLNDRLHDAPPGLRRHLELARELVRNCLDEARRSVWKLRAQALDEVGLAGSLSRLGRELTNGREMDFDLQIAGSPRELPADVENNLLRTGQEALTNAVRHSGARRIVLKLLFLEDRVRLVVSDDGKGFDASQVHSTPQGGYGLTGLRERATAMHASLEIVRGAAGGTTIELSVPHV